MTSSKTTHVLVCTHKTCHKRGGRDAAKELKHALKEEGLRDQVLVTSVHCLDQCDHGPVVVVYPEGVWYAGVDEQATREIVEQHIKRKHAVERKVLFGPGDDATGSDG